ncbi:MAG: protein kinase [Acidimicrobiales bacterium]|nr:protein kinase [Acidimicrobiales bacterium]
MSALYDAVVPLKRGSGTGTLSAIERGTGLRVVVKYVECASLSEEAKARLHREVALLEASHDPEMASVYGSVKGERLYLVMPYVDGVSLGQRLHDRGPLTVEDALTVTREVLFRLRRMHLHGLIHRGVSPSNIILPEHSPLRTAALVDLGFASAAFLAPDEGPSRASSPWYMAPELAGVLDRPVDGRSDLYSTGIVLFECLAGRPPFGGADVRDVLRHHLSTVAPPLRSLGVAVPQVLEEIIRRLLHKDPDDRYQSAEAVLGDIDDLRRALGSGIVEPEVALGSHDRRVSLTEPPLTGRLEELSVLTTRLQDARRGPVRPVVLEAVSGGGKTRVLDEFCQRALAGGARVFRGRGIDRSARPPLHMFGGIVADLLAQAREDPEFGRHVAVALNESARPLCDALPELEDLLGEAGAQQSSLPEHLLQVRLVGALVELLAGLGAEARPALVVFDDCQWSDEVTLQVLEAVAGEGPCPGHMMLVVAMRAEESGPHLRLKEIRGVDTISLPPLDVEQIAQVVESMAGKVPVGVTQVVVDLSRGNPLMVSAVLRGLVEDTVLSPTSAGWRFDPGPGRWQASRGAAVLLARRFSLLAPGTRRLLDAGAVLGRDFDPLLAARLVGEDRAGVERAIELAIERHLVWDSTDGRVSFAHDRLRASLLAGLDPIELVELHRRAGEVIEESEPGQAFDLAYHFDAAGEPDRAFPYALDSARAAWIRHDIEAAERQYLIAERGMRNAPPATQYALAEELGKVFMRRGRYDKAEQRFQQARALAEDSLQLAWIECQLGELTFRRDDLDGAAAHMEAGLHALGEEVTFQGRRHLVIGVVREAAHRMARGGPRRQRRRRPSEEHRADLLKAHLYTRLQYPRWFHSRRLETFWLMLRQVNLAERCPPASEQLAHAYAVWGGAIALTFPFLSRRAMTYVEHALSIYRSNGNLRGEGHAASMRACVLHAAGRYEEAVQSAEHAIHALGQFGDRWELGFATRTRAACLYRLGRFYEAQEAARRLGRIGLEVGDANAEITALEILAKTADGRVPVVETRAALSLRGDDIEVTTAALQAEALRLRHAGQLAEAIERLQTAADLVSRAQPTSTHLVPVFAWLATCRRELAEQQLLPHDRRRLLRAARRSARRALRYGTVYPNDLPHALRELGMVHALSGNGRRARRCLNRSAERALSRDAQAELRETNLQRDRLGLADGVPGAQQTREQGPAAGQLVPPTLGLAERFAALLDAGALLASCNSAEDTVRAIRDISHSLLRAEQCHIVGLLAQGRPDVRGLSPDHLTAIQRVGDHGHPVVLPAPFVTDGDGFEGAAPQVARSALCAPVFARQEIVGYFFVLHTKVDALFGEEERQLAEFVARLAGASLERQWLERDSRGRVVAAQEGERARVARDLHDEIGQALTSVLLHAMSVDSAVTGVERTVVDPTEVSRRVGELRQDVAQALEAVQRLAFDMRPAVLDDLGLEAALRRLLTRTATGGVTIELETVDLEPGDRLPHDVETTAYRIVQEAVTNVVRHSQADHCSVILGRARQRLRIVVEDDGHGFDSKAEGPDGLGLLGMRERAALVSGTLAVCSVPGRGTEVVFEAPL